MATQYHTEDHPFAKDEGSTFETAPSSSTNTKSRKNTCCNIWLILLIILTVQLTTVSVVIGILVPSWSGHHGDDDSNNKEKAKGQLQPLLMDPILFPGKIYTGVRLDDDDQQADPARRAQQFSQQAGNLIQNQGGLRHFASYFNRNWDAHKEQNQHKPPYGRRPISKWLNQVSLMNGALQFWQEKGGPTIDSNKPVTTLKKRERPFHLKTWGDLKNLYKVNKFSKVLDDTNKRAEESYRETRIGLMRAYLLQRFMIPEKGQQPKSSKRIQEIRGRWAADPVLQEIVFNHMTQYAAIMDSHGKEDPKDSPIIFVQTEVKMLEFASKTLEDFISQLENFHLVTGRNLDDEYKKKIKIERKNTISQTDHTSTVIEYLFPRDLFSGMYRGTFTKKVNFRTNVRLTRFNELTQEFNKLEDEDLQPLESQLFGGRGDGKGKNLKSLLKSKSKNWNMVVLFIVFQSLALLSLIQTVVVGILRCRSGRGKSEDGQYEGDVEVANGENDDLQY